MNRADPFFERDATGWQTMKVAGGRPALHYNLYSNTNRVVAFDPKTGMPADSAYQDPAKRIPPQMHY